MPYKQHFSTSFFPSLFFSHDYQRCIRIYHLLLFPSSLFSFFWSYFPPFVPTLFFQVKVTRGRKKHTLQYYLNEA